MPLDGTPANAVDPEMEDNKRQVLCDSHDDQHRPQPACKAKRIVVDDDDDSDGDEDSDDDAGSLVDFIEDDPDDEEDAESVVSEPPASMEEAIARDLDGIDQSNIVTGKRTRKQTTFYEHEVFASEDYRKMVLLDVPDDEMDAVFEEDAEGEEEEDDDDASFHAEDEEEEDDDDYNQPNSPQKE